MAQCVGKEREKKKSPLNWEQSQLACVVLHIATVQDNESRLSLPSESYKSIYFLKCQLAQKNDFLKNIYSLSDGHVLKD